jgi:chromosomal replication initiator protein
MKQITAPAAALLNPHHTFETLIVGGSNRATYAAAVAVAEFPGQRHNPFFIYGNVGLGKEHLLHAIGNQALRLHPDLVVRCATAERLINELAQAGAQGRLHEFRESYVAVDMLLVEDIQYLAQEQRTQEVFLDIFNTLYHAGKQIVVTCDRHPDALTTLMEPLRERFHWGLIAKVQPPDLDERIAILQTKAQQRAVPVPKPVIDYVARRVVSDIRALEGALTSISAGASLQGTPITLELAIAMLDGMSRNARHLKPSLEEVLQVVLTYYTLDRAALLGPRRNTAITLPRQVAMYVMRHETDASLSSIGRFLGNRSHSTVLHGCEKIAYELEHGNAQVRKDLAGIRTLLFGG